MRKRILVIRARRPGNTSVLPLGVAYESFDGWRFTPFTSAHRSSRKGHATWEKCLPRWTGGLDRTESIVMLHGDTVPDAMKRFPPVPEFETA